MELTPMKNNKEAIKVLLNDYCDGLPEPPPKWMVDSTIEALSDLSIPVRIYIAAKIILDCF